MAESSWPNPAASHTVSDVQYEQLMSGLTTDGIAGAPSDTAVVYADSTGMQVKVRANKLALVRGHGWNSGSVDFTKTIGANSSGNPRVDLVVLRLDRSTWAVTTVVKAGTPAASNPTPPALQQDADPTGGGSGLWEIPLATVNVANGATGINPADVTPIGWYLGEPILLTTGPAARPTPKPGVVLCESGDYLVAAGSSWLRLTTVNEAQTLTAGMKQTTGAYPYSNNFAWGWFAQLAAPMIAGHTYDLRLDCTAASGDIGNLPINVRVGIWLVGGANAIVFDEKFLQNTIAFGRFSLSAPYLATTTGTVTFMSTAERRDGNARFDIRVGPDMPMWFRAIDLGNRVTIGGT